MTISRGVRVLAAPCCGARYAFPNYVSMNFSAFEYWTDGWRELSPMPNDEGLRLCQCGQFVLLKNMVKVDADEGADLPYMNRVSTAQLPDCIERAVDEEMKIAARLEYWRYLNHEYRERYRQHRDAEEANIKVEWEAANPDNRSWWAKLRRVQPPAYRRPANSPFTYPPFEPTAEQLENMAHLTKLLIYWGDASGGGKYILQLAELYREQGLFQKAESMIQKVADDAVDVTSRLIARLIKEKDMAPMRYRM